MARTVKSTTQRLLRDGTAVGPVTPEMIARAKERFAAACMPGEKVGAWDWMDFLGPVRIELGVKTWKELGYNGFGGEKLK